MNLHLQSVITPRHLLAFQRTLKHAATCLVGLLCIAALPAAADNYVVDPSFGNSPQFRERASPSRITSGPSGKSYVTFVNGGALTGVDNQRRGAVIRLNTDGALDPSFNVGSQFTAAWAVLEMANGQVLVGAVDANEGGDSGVPLYRVFRLNSNGTRDLSYQSPVFAAIPRFMTMQSDGRLLVANQGLSGSFQAGTGNGGLESLQRLNSNGSLDTSFVSPVLPADGSVLFSNIVVDSAGRILVGGLFSTIAGQSRPGIARLLSNGTLDTTFVPSGFVSPNQVRGIAIQTQGANAGKIVIAGGPLRTTTASPCFTGNGTAGSNSCPLLRLNPDGSLDTTFTLVTRSAPGVISTRPRLLTILPDDKMLIVSNGVARFNADGSLDTSYNKPVFTNASGGIGFEVETFWMDTLADGRVYVPIVPTTNVNGSPTTRQIIRFSPGGSIDNTFAPGTFQQETYPEALAVLPNGQFLAWGDFDTVGTTARTAAARFNPDGSLDSSFAISGVPSLLGIPNASVLSDGKLLAAIKTGREANAAGNPLGIALARFSATGTLDTSYIPDSSVAAAYAETVSTGGEFGIRTLGDGRALVFGLSSQRVIDNNIYLRRLNTDGSLDSSFAGLTLPSGALGTVYPDPTNGNAITSGSFTIVGRYTDGRWIAAVTKPPYPLNTTSFNFTLIRLNADGSLDNSFNAPTIPWTTATAQNFYTVGTQDYLVTQPRGSPFSHVHGLADGSVIVAGSFTAIDGQAVAGVARLSNGGVLDASFLAGGGVRLNGSPGRVATVKRITADLSGKFWLTGAFNSIGGQTSGGIARLNADGTIDNSFSTPLTYRPFVGGDTRIVFDAANRPMVLGSFMPGADGFPDSIHRLTLELSLNLTASWNLLGNSTSTPLAVASVFGNPIYVSSVWKWNATSHRWAFYTPAMQDGGAAYAASNQYDVLTNVNAGEGFWVNAARRFTVQLPSGTSASVTVSDFANQLTPPNRLPSGWSLIATGDNKTPSGFNRALSATPPAQEVVPININSLWAWDANASNWYFYAPSLDAAGTLSNHVTTQNLLPFGANTLSPTTGFWVSKP